MSIRERIQSDINKALGKSGLPAEALVVSTSDPKFGDYTTSWALQQSRVLGRSSKDLATALIEALPKSEVYDCPELVEPGFVNFHLSKVFLGKHLSLVLSEDSKFGSANTHKGEKAVVEFSQPNIAKPLSVGNLRNINLGQSLTNILSFVGYQVITEIHLGDWGTQFGKLLWAYKMWGHSIPDPTVEDLVKLYVRFHQESETRPHMEVEARQEFLMLEQGNKENLRLWEKFKEITMVEVGRTYSELGVRFDMMHGESFYVKELPSIIKMALKAGVAEKDPDGSVLIRFPDMPPLMILKSDGATIYGTRDLAAAKYRIDTLSPKLMVYVVGSEQSLYLKQVFEAVKKLGWSKGAELVHVSYGLTKLQGGKMSTRLGNVVTTEEALREAKERAAKLLSEKSSVRVDNKLVRDIAVGSIKWADLKISKESEVTFDWDKVFSWDGNSGPYMQYSYARTQSLLKKVSKDELTTFDASLLVGEKEISLLRILAKFPEVVQESADTFSPHLLAQYSFSLAQEFSRFYESVSVLSSELEIKKARLSLVRAVGTAIRSSLYLLAIPTPERI